LCRPGLWLGREWHHNRLNIVVPHGCGWGHPPRDYPGWDSRRAQDVLVDMMRRGVFKASAAGIGNDRGADRSKKRARRCLRDRLQAEIVSLREEVRAHHGSGEIVERIPAVRRRVGHEWRRPETRGCAAEGHRSCARRP
jgi:hypothetical protein